MAYQQFHQHGGRVVKAASGMAAAILIGTSVFADDQQHWHLERAPWTSTIILQEMTSSGAVFSPQQG